MTEKVALGKAVAKAGQAIIVRPKSFEDRLDALENMVALLGQTSRQTDVKELSKSLNAYSGMPKNKDGIPIGISLLGQSKFGARILYVAEDGYYIGQDKFLSLSAAAEAVSGIVRKSGWIFWKLPNGMSLKETYKSRRE